MADPAAKYQSIADQLKDPDTQLLLARVLRGEAGGNAEDMYDVLGTVINRARQSGQSIHDVLLSQGQFTSIGPLPGAEGGERAKLEGLGQDALGPEYSVINQGIPNFDPATGTLKLPSGQVFNPGVNKFFAPKAQREYAAKYPGVYQPEPGYAKTTKPTYSAGGQQFYVGAPYTGGLKVMPDLAAPTGSSAVNQAIAAQPFGMPQLTPEQQKQVDEDEARIRELQPQVEANIEAMAPVYDEQVKHLQTNLDRANELYGRFDKTVQGLYDSMPDEHKMEIAELRKVSDEPMNPSRALGQWLPMLAVIGGAFTKAGAIGSLGAAADAMNAARSHDDEALKRADSNFHDQLAETIDKGHMALDMLSQGISQTQGDNAAMAEMARITGLKLDIPHLVQASRQGDINSIYATQAGLIKGLNAMSLLQTRTLKIQQMEAALQGSGPMATDALTWNAERYRLTGVLPALGMGQAAADLRKQILDKAEAISTASDLSDHDLQIMQDADSDVSGMYAVKAQAGALNWVTKTRTQVEQFEGTAQREADLVLDKAAKGTAGGIPVINKWIQAGRRAVVGDPAVTDFDSAMTSFVGEYARIMTTGGTGGGGMTTDAARGEVNKLLNDSMNLKQVQDQIATMKQSMKNRMDALNATYQETIGGMPGAGGAVGAGALPGTPLPTAQAGGGQAGSAGGDSKTFLQGDEKQQFRDFIFNSLEDVRTGKHPPYKNRDWVKSQLKEQFKDAPDAEIEQGVNAIMAGKRG